MVATFFPPQRQQPQVVDSRIIRDLRRAGISTEPYVPPSALKGLEDKEPDGPDLSETKITAGYLDSCRRLGDMPLHSSVRELPNNLVAKWGKRVHPGEAYVLKYIEAEGVRLPVPRVYACFKEEESGYWCIIMDKITGTSLEITRDGYSPAQQDEVTEQLRAMLASLRVHQRKEIGSFSTNLNVGPASDRFFLSRDRAGPFAREQDFVTALGLALRARCNDNITEGAIAMLNAVPRTDRFVLTNGRLGLDNILVRGTKIVGILSWSQAGFYPQYWEYAKAAFFDNDFFDPANVIRLALDPYLPELSAMLHVRDIVY